jgi:hypothetical protein
MLHIRLIAVVSALALGLAVGCDDGGGGDDGTGAVGGEGEGEGSLCDDVELAANTACIDIDGVRADLSVTGAVIVAGTLSLAYSSDGNNTPPLLVLGWAAEVAAGTLECSGGDIRMFTVTDADGNASVGRGPQPPPARWS